MLSWAGEVASESEAGRWILCLGESVGEFLEGVEILAMAIAEVDQSKAGEGERVGFWSQSFLISNGKRVDVGHSGALARGAVHCTGSGLRLRLGSRRMGSGAGEDSVKLTLLWVESRRASAWRSRFWRRDSWGNWRMCVNGHFGSSLGSDGCHGGFNWDSR